MNIYSCCQRQPSAQLFHLLNCNFRKINIYYISLYTMDDDLLVSKKRSVVSQAWTRLSQWYQGVVDRTVPWQITRWIAAVILIALFMCRVRSGGQDTLFMCRVLYAQGWYIVTYALGIYHLNLFIAFLTPKIDPAMDFDADENGPELPTRANEEFRPFIRRLPEFKFWYSVTKSTVIALVCTFFDCFNIPVFWPILVLYFITLFCVTMKRQIKHMIKYRYLPFTHGKPKYQGHEDSGKVIGSPK
ncbi:Rer1 family [Popillia japonica]|uniref:Rer1 family n=2 Tax=Popillia japonica TaxID=7064 RepID=A0AAW1L826_POPJA